MAEIIRRKLTGNKARQAITSRLFNNPKAQQMARDVCAFYGEALVYEESPDFDSSHFGVIIPDHINFEHGLLQLKTGTDRVIEALVHELLHLRLPVLGYPMVNKVEISDRREKLAEKFLEMYGVIGNVIQHEVFIEDFIALGFDRSKFLGKYSPAQDYEAGLEDTLATKKIYIGEVGFSWWCLEYLRLWITYRHTGFELAMVDAEKALRYGTRHHSDFEPATKRMVEWVIDSDLTSTTYATQLNELFEIMHVPTVTGWLWLQGSGNPVAVSTPPESGQT